ncbi:MULTISPECIES: YceI family protein [Catenuloplanes]|uniref:Polyisoprenoid-binding protein YceI n=1 Tax=Catenuloplanes niger TaxID=587534 RepID=A0AAE4CS31_9ACTN|nr:YceI family protein [Catenuloplanes niger]MDR7322137.1 polyisoprenoid-binding protein YceI [Catenuloplanes niger]
MADSPTREWNGMVIPSPGTYELDEAHKRVGFTAQHMMVSPVRGEFTRARATITVADDPLQSGVTAVIQANSIDTTNPERDAHLSGADFLDVETFPTLEFRSTGVKYEEPDDAIFSWAKMRAGNKLTRRSVATVPEPAAKRSGRFVLSGDLRIKDVTHPVELKVEFGGARRDPYGRDIVGFSAHTEINREDYGLLWNVALESGGVLVGKKVRIEIAGEAIRGA